MKEHARATACHPWLAAIHEATSHGAEIESSCRASSLLRWSRSFHGTMRSRWSSRCGAALLLATAAGGDVPDGFDLGAAHCVDAIVQIDGGVAVWREELHELAERGHASLLRHESAVLIARPRVFDARPLDRLGHEGLVRRERLQAAADHAHSRRGHA